MLVKFALAWLAVTIFLSFFLSRLFFFAEECSKSEMTRTREASQRISRGDFQEHVDELDADHQTGFEEEFKVSLEGRACYGSV